MIHHYGVQREDIEGLQKSTRLLIPYYGQWFEKGDVLIFFFHHDSSAIYKVVMKHPLKFIDEGVCYYELELF